jgi:hypothetical protein
VARGMSGTIFLEPRRAAVPPRDPYDDEDEEDEEDGADEDGDPEPAVIREPDAE